MAFVRPRPNLVKDDQLEGASAYLARERRVLFLRGPIVSLPFRWDAFGVTAVHDALLAMNFENPQRPIYLFIESDGGDVQDGLTLYDVIRASVAPVVTVGVSAASMATVLLAAGRRRLLYPHARVMLHLPSAGLQGDVKELEIKTKELSRVRDTLVDAYLQCGVKRTRDEILRDIDREYWLNANEAIEYGLADAIITREELFGLVGNLDPDAVTAL